MIKAHQKVLKSVPQAELIIAGFGEAQKYLEELTEKLAMSNKVKFLGKVSEEEKVELMYKSWVFAYPSSMEGWGISIIEASASGTAVVASDVPGLRDSVKNPTTGYLVELGNHEKFAERIINIVTNHELRSKFEKAGVKWAENFSWEISANKFMAVIKKAMENNSNE